MKFFNKEWSLVGGANTYTTAKFENFLQVGSLHSYSPVASTLTHDFVLWDSATAALHKVNLNIWNLYQLIDDLPISHGLGGTGLTDLGSPGQILSTNAAGTAMEWITNPSFIDWTADQTILGGAGVIHFNNYPWNATVWDEIVEDLVGDMFGNGTHSGITATYNDATGVINLSTTAISVIKWDGSFQDPYNNSGLASGSPATSPYTGQTSMYDEINNTDTIRFAGTGGCEVYTYPGGYAASGIYPAGPSRDHVVEISLDKCSILHMIENQVGIMLDNGAASNSNVAVTYTPGGATCGNGSISFNHNPNTTIYEEAIQDIVGEMFDGSILRNIEVGYDDVNGKININNHKKEHIIIAVSDQVTDLVTTASSPNPQGVANEFRMPYDFHCTEIRLSCSTASTGADIKVDIQLETSTPNVWASIFSTLIQIDENEYTSKTASVPYVIASPPPQPTALTSNAVDFDDDERVRIFIDQVGSTNAGKGLKVMFIGFQTGDTGQTDPIHSDPYYI